MPIVLIRSAALILSLAATSATAQTQPPCRLPSELTRVPELPEASGVAASRRTSGTFWAHNDSGEPVLFVLDGRGAVTARVRLTGATVDDWEDIAVGPCGPRFCLYIADIGDNSGNRDHIRVYRTSEPAAGEASTPPVEVLEATYPDGSHDAEALFVLPDGGLHIITKGDPGPVALYRFPPTVAAGKRVQLERIGGPTIDAKKTAPQDRPTAADVSPDGRWVAVRTTQWIGFYRTTDLAAGRWSPAVRMDLRGLDEPRGEGITFADDGTIVLVGEGGAVKGAGTFARLTCTLPG